MNLAVGVCSENKNKKIHMQSLSFYRSSNAKQGPHTAFNAYKEFLQKDTAALFLAAAMEHFGLKDVGGTSSSR